jgi:DNA-binding transcriptional ArsR family regulator
VDDLLREQRKTNRILLMAFGEAIDNRVKGFLAHAQTKSVLTILAEGEVAADELQTRAKAGGVPRSSLYKILSDLERAGVIERPKRGTVELASFAAPFVPTARKGATEKEGEPTAEQVELGAPQQ